MDVRIAAGLEKPPRADFPAPGETTDILPSVEIGSTLKEMPPHMKRRAFTLDEANRTLPLVRHIATDVARAYRELSDRAERYKVLRSGQDRSDATEEALNDLKRSMAVLTSEIDAFVAELLEIGCEMKDLASGTVDFPSVLDGRQVFLCWQPGEDCVEFWHEVTDGFSGRRPLPVAVTEE